MRVDLASGTPVELVLPSAGQPRRGVVLGPDVMGLRPLFEEMATRLAEEHGWAVAVVEPFPGGADLTREQRQAQRLDVARVVADLQAAAGVLNEKAGVIRVAVVGFCMGGMNTFRAAGTGYFDKAVAFYGLVRPAEAWSEPGSDPLDALASPRCCPVLAVCGAADELVPPADVAALEAAGPHVSVQLYDGAGHGFVHDPERPSHRPDDAADAWKRAVEFLA